tara:strand:+ start:4150 stop:5496 length:1347 start_codon:yes stop_codon:yes gene_type:complete
MGDFTSISANATGSGVDLDNTRRIFNFGDRVAELAPQQSPFFVYLNKVAKKPTDDPVFKFLEQRHQWQRRNFAIDNAPTWDKTANVVGTNSTNDIAIDCGYNSAGQIEAEQPCNFIVPGQIIALKNVNGSVYRIKILETATVDATGGAGTIKHEASQTLISGSAMKAIDDASGSGTWANGDVGQVIGTSWGEGTKAPVGWEDIMVDKEGYCQIFKTAMNLFSNTARATRYRGVSNEYQRIWTDKLMEHKMDMEQAFLFGVGDATNGALSTRYTHGIVPYTESNGKVYNFSYASSGYDAFLDAMEDFFAPEGGNSGNKLVLASRKVITYLNKLGSGSFLNNSVGSSQYKLDVTSIPGTFGHQVTKVNTIYGSLHFVAEPLLRGPWENYCCAVDMKNVAYRPLVGNGINRDTFVETNIQGNDEDGRRDQIITEAGLEISLPETHAVMKWS